MHYTRTHIKSAKVALALGALCSINAAFALDTPSSSDLDRRLYTTAYEEDQVYPIYAVNGLVTTIVFS